MGIVKIHHKRHGNKYLYLGTYAGSSSLFYAYDPETEYLTEYDIYSMHEPSEWKGSQLPHIPKQHSVIHQDLFGQLEVVDFPKQISRGFTYAGKTYKGNGIVVRAASTYSQDLYYTESTYEYHQAIKFDVLEVTKDDRSVKVRVGNGESYLYRRHPGDPWKQRSHSTFSTKTLSANLGGLIMFACPDYPDHSLTLWSYLLTQGQIEEIDEAITASDPDHLDWGNLALGASESIRLLDINGIAYMKDLLEIASLAKSVADLNWVKTARSFSKYYSMRHTGSIADKAKKAWKSVDGVQMLKGASGTYLSNHYGTRLMVKDTKDIAKAIDRLDLTHNYERMGAKKDFAIPYSFGMFTDIRGERSFTADIRSWSDQQLDGVRQFAEAANQLGDRLLRLGYELDVLPSPSNLWDLVPWSFVVDWFVPIGDALERQESTGYLHTLRPVRVFCSSKFTATQAYDTQAEGRRISGDLRYRCFYRIVTHSFPSVPIMSDYPWFGLQSHWLEATALVVQVKSRR